MTNHRDPRAARESVLLALCFATAAGLAQGQAQNPESAEGAEAGETLQEVVVLGRGEARQLLGLGADQIALQPPGTSPLKAIEKLPGVNFQSADPFGIYEWSTRITVRGFNQNQLGFTLDGIPLGDMSYGNHNGLHVSRAIPSENIDLVTISQGAGALGTASSSNLGGTLQFRSGDPDEAFGARVQLMGGADSARRVYGRVDSGELGSLGTRFFISAFDHSTDKWKGEGDQKQRMYNLKLVQPIGEAKLTAFFNDSDRAEIDYQDLSFDIIRRRGAGWDNWFPDWNSAVGAAQSCAAQNFSATICDDAYWNAAGLRKDRLGYLAAEIPFGENVSFAATVYQHRNEGQGLWGTPYVPTPAGAPLSIRTTEYDIDRVGGFGSLRFSVGQHQIEAGFWVENNDFNQARRFYPEPNRGGPTRSFLEFQRNPLLTQWEYVFDTSTRQFSLQDTWTLNDAFRVNFGFKTLNVENEATTIVGPNKTGSIEVDESFLPQVGAAWTLSEDNEIFGQFARNAAAFVSANTAGPFATTLAGFQAIRDTLEPETSTSFELGWRFRAPNLQGVIAAYRIDFDDRLLAIQQGPGIVGNPSVLANVGSVETLGVEAALAWRPAQNLTWFNSATWNQSEYADDYVTNGVVVRTGGKTVVNAPELLLRSEIAYDTGRVFARLDGNYTAKRYYTFLNQGEVDAYTLFNASAGIRFEGLGLFRELTLQAQVTNLADEEYIATIGSNGFSNADPTGTSQTLLEGAPRQWFITVNARF